MHPGLTNLVGRILEFELQTKIRWPSLLARACYYCVNIKLSWYSFDLQEAETQVYRQDRDYSVFKKFIPKQVLQIGKGNIELNSVNIYFCDKEHEVT